MRKCLLIPLIVFSFQSYAQTQYEFDYRLKRDSLKEKLPRLTDSARVDCLNILSDIYESDVLGTNYRKEVDTAGIYAKEALNEAKLIGYKKGMAYSYIRIGAYYFTRADNGFDKTALYDSIEQNINQAIKIGTSINNNVIVGYSYQYLASIGWMVGDDKKFLNNSQQAISYYSKPGLRRYEDSQPDFDGVKCEQCNGNEIRIGKVYMTVAQFYSNHKKEDSAIISTKMAIYYFQKADYPYGLGWSYSLLANLNFKRNNNVEGTNNAEQSEAFTRRSGCDLCLVNYYIQFGNWYLGLGEFEKGLEYAKKCADILLKITPKSQNDSDLKYTWHWRSAYNLMCSFYIVAGDYETALTICQQAYPYYKGNGYDLKGWEAQMGELYRLLGNYDSAKYYLASFEDFQKGQTGLMGKSYLSRLFIDLDQFDNALRLINGNINYLKETNEPRSLGYAMVLAAQAYNGKKNFNTALTYARAGLHLQKSMSRKVNIVDTYKLLANIFENLERTDSAYFYFKQYTALKDSLLNRQFLWKLNNFKREAEEERKTGQINLLNKENQLKEQRLKQEGTFRNSLIAGIVMLFLLGIFIFRNLLLKRKNEKLELQNELSRRQLENDKKHAELKQQATELEMQALRAQMNPHFIFNCLSSINRFIFKNETKGASDYLTRFSRLIRMVLMHSQKKLIPLEDELEMLRLYLEMERLRFKNAFDYGITTTNSIESTSVFIPPLILQPFCENAIWHGLMHKEGPGRLNIAISESNGILNCVIEDDGIGRQRAAALRSKSVEKEKSLGLQITAKRLALLNGGNSTETFYSIDDIINDDGDVVGTRVSIKIRYRENIEELV